MRRLVLVIPFAAVAAVLAGCGSSGTATTSATTTAPTSTPPATVTDTVVPPTTTATATTTASSSGPVDCATANLTVSLGAGQGAAGHEIYAIHFVNKGSATCTISAYPGVSFVAPGNGQQVGAAGVRTNGGSAATVTLTSGAEASSLVSIANYENFTPSECNATAVSGLRVYPPNNQTSAYVAFPSQTKACTIGSSQISVQPVAAGSGS